MNIWTSENFAKYKLNNSPGHGEWLQHNGENAISLSPARFYSNGTFVKIFENEFFPNIQYVFNLYLDTDNITHNNNNAPGGIQIHYTDGTVVTLNKKGDQTNLKGWQNIFFITDITKSVSHITIYYYVGLAVPYRWDSYVGPLQVANVEQSGLFNAGTLINNYDINDTASIQNGGILYSNTFYEF